MGRLRHYLDDIVGVWLDFIHLQVGLRWSLVTSRRESRSRKPYPSRNWSTEKSGLTCETT